MDHRMFRYLEKYVGKYRVMAPYDEVTNDFPRDENGNIDPSFDDLYIPCKRGVIKHTYKPEQLCYYLEAPKTINNIAKAINEKYGDKVKITVEVTSGEGMIFFEDDDFKKIATIVKPSTRGAVIPPYSSKNLPQSKYNIPEKDTVKLNKELEKHTKKLEPLEAARLTRKIISDFDNVIQNKMGKHYDIKAKKQESGLKPKEFIHSIGMWKEFIDFVKEYKPPRKRRTRKTKEKE